MNEDDLDTDDVDEGAKLDMDQLVEKALKLEAEIDVVSNHLKELEKEYRTVIEKELVQAVLATGFKEGTTIDGEHKIKVTSNLYVTELQDYNKKRELMRKRAEWLEANDGASLIKENIEIAFDKGEHAEAVALAAILKGMGIPYVQAETINTSSLKSFVNDMLTEGNDVPLDQLGLYQRTEAKISSAARKRK